MRLVLCVAVMAGLTYLLRALPFALIRRKIRSRFVRSFLYYVPYAVLTAMTIPAIFTAASDPVCAVGGFIAALVCAFLRPSLLAVACATCGGALAVEGVRALLTLF